MEETIPRKPVDVSNEFKASRTQIYDYTMNTFGELQANRYLQKIEKALSTLYVFYYAYPQCRFLATKSRMYRNIILDAHLIVYRITVKRIEVLDIIHSASSISKFRNLRKIRL